MNKHHQILILLFAVIVTAAMVPKNNTLTTPSEDSKHLIAEEPLSLHSIIQDLEAGMFGNSTMLNSSSTCGSMGCGSSSISIYLGNKIKVWGETDANGIYDEVLVSLVLMKNGNILYNGNKNFKYVEDTDYVSFEDVYDDYSSNACYELEASHRFQNGSNSEVLFTYDSIGCN